MSAVSKAITDVKFRIPMEILHIVFIKRLQQYRQNPTSIDNQILTEVVRPRVMVDCNLIGGTEVFISLEGLPFERTNDYTSIYRIPKDRSNGRSINSVLNITFTDPTRLSSYAATTQCQATPMLLMAQSVLDALGPAPITSSAYVQLIGENVVMVRDSVLIPANSYMRCILSNDESMSHLQLRSYPVFSKAVEFAVKAYIYNAYIIQMDIGELQGGHNLGRIKEVIDGYADAEQNYQDYLREVMQKVEFMNDGESFKRLLRIMTGTQR